MKKEITLIIGSSGTIGSELVKILRNEGHELRLATSRTPKGPGEVQVDLGTGKGLKEAFQGVDRAFLLSPPGFADHYQILAPMIIEAKKNQLKKVVLMTAMGANASDSTPFRRAEIELENSGLTYNIVRPNWFMQNFNTFWVQGIKAHRKIQLPAGTAKTSFIDSKDVSAVIAKLLFSEEFNNQDFDLTADQAISHDEVAQMISKEVGAKVEYQDISSAQFMEPLVTAGFPKDYVEFMALIFGFLKAGYNERVTVNVSKVLGRSPNTFLKYAQASKNAWI